jgi:hypothetical protein
LEPQLVLEPGARSGADEVIDDIELVFQSVRNGKPMRDNNILSRFIKPAGRKLGLGFVNWRCLRTSWATWAIEAGIRIEPTNLRCSR